MNEAQHIVDAADSTVHNIANDVLVLGLTSNPQFHTVECFHHFCYRQDAAKVRWKLSKT